MEGPEILNQSPKRTTILFPVENGEIILGMKKRGFGEGWWNGFGGKLDENESYEQAAIRETIEESGLTPEEIKHIANLEFFFDNILKIVSKAYICTRFSGETIETEEMKPCRFKPHEIPYDTMWPGDRHWVEPSINNSGKPLHFKLYFDNDKNFIKYEQIELNDFDSFF